MSPTMLGRYGTGGFDWPDAPDSKGCPRQYKARYVDKSVSKETTIWLSMGRVIHHALQLMEDEAIGPEEALEKAWDIALPMEMYAEALADLRKYLERSSTPLDRYGTWATEVHLECELFVDDEFGPINCQGIVDRISIDMDDPDVIHLGDWKWGYKMWSLDEVRRSGQLKMYVFLLMHCWEQLRLPRKPRRIVVHLDLIKWRELPAVVYSEDDMEAWHAYTVAVVRKILRDEEAKPRINEGCAYCPVRDDCPAFQGISDLGLHLLQVKPALPQGQDPSEDQIKEYADKLVAWREQAWATKSLLEKAVKHIDGQFISDAMRLGEVSAGGFRWYRATQYTNHVDTRRLHKIIGERFYDEASVTKTRLELLAKEYPDEEVMDCLGSEPTGTTVKRTKE